MMFVLLLTYEPEWADPVPYDQSKTHCGGVYTTPELAKAAVPKVAASLSGKMDEYNILPVYPDTPIINA